MLFVRENTEGEYSGTGGRVHVGHAAELAVEVPVFTKRAIERCARLSTHRAIRCGVEAVYSVPHCAPFSWAVTCR